MQINKTPNTDYIQLSKHNILMFYYISPIPVNKHLIDNYHFARLSTIITVYTRHILDIDL